MSEDDASDALQHQAELEQMMLGDDIGYQIWLDDLSNRILELGELT